MRYIIKSLLMKFLFTTALLVSFVGVAAFGFSGMHYNDSQDHGGSCIWAASQGVDCPKQGSTTNYLTFHLDAFKGFSTAIFVGNVMSSLFLTLTSLLFIGLAFLSPNLFKPPQLAFYRHQYRDSFSPHQKQRLTRWLALHENSPATL